MSLNLIKTNIDAALKAAADPRLAKPMASYMKNHFSFLGIKTPQRRQATKDLVTETKKLSVKDLLDLVNWLWEVDQREYQYIAVDILAKNYLKFSLANIKQLIRLAQEKSWWDSVDGLSSVINKILRKSLASDKNAQNIMDESILHENMWVRRIALLHQLGWKDDTDEQRLFDYAKSQASDENFFIRKAIGWALRDYARHNPERVYSFLDENESIWSNLTYREATKHR
ncbi:unnamed protein product [Blepharisma stoltei]|uniref:DNA alkylation repair protein n=1 Tax=Blepharisma stoltei TaxID=1481888 RepID=A0AAU9J8D1_9CILI|nr:unnamed protein product [Blepharisma stoltei]